ncbi:hypothetical protein BgiBS90_008915, partial [Biomphalaria glabrata]
LFNHLSSQQNETPMKPMQSACTVLLKEAGLRAMTAQTLGRDGSCQAQSSEDTYGALQNT